MQTLFQVIRAHKNTTHTHRTAEKENKILKIIKLIIIKEYNT